MVLLCADGVTEAQDEARSFYSMGRLWKLLGSAAPPDAKAAVEVVREDVSRFVAGAEQADDITFSCGAMAGARFSYELIIGR